jgi:ribosomal protein S27AE
MSEEMSCLFCKGTGKIKKKQIMPDFCPRCGKPVFLHESKIDGESKSYQFVCFGCGTIAGGTTDINHDMTRPEVCARYRGNKQDYVRIMKERFNITVG